MAHNHPWPKTGQIVVDTDEEVTSLMAAMTLSRLEAIEFAYSVECVRVYLGIGAIDVPQAMFLLEEAGVLDAILGPGEDLP
jgi:6,7-dimethyl-8-ribityllumazine synthase